MADKTLNDVVNELRGIKDIVSSTRSSVESNQATLGTTLTNSLKGLKLSNTLKGITNSLKGLKASTLDMRDTLAIKLMYLGDSIKNSVKSFGDKIFSKITAPFKAIADKFNSIKESIMAPFDTIKGALKGVSNFVGNLGKGFLGLFRKKKDPNKNNHKLIEAGNKILGDIRKGFSKFTEQLKVQANRAKEGAREQLESLKKLGGGGAGGGGGDGVPGKGKGAGIFSKIGSTIGGVVGGIVDGIGGGFAKVGKKVGSVLAGALAIAAIGASLIPAAKAFQMFSEVSWKGVAAGLVVLGALVLAVMGLGAIMSSGVGTIAILAGAAALAIIGLAMVPAAKAFQMFSEALNEQLIPAFEKFGPIVNDFIDRLVVSFGNMSDIVSGFIGDVVNVLVSAFERGVEVVGGLIEEITTQITRLGALDGNNLLQVAAGVTALGVALIGFGAGGAVGGIIGSIGEGFAKLFGGGESPMDRVFKFAEKATQISLAATAMHVLAKGLNNVFEAMKNGKFEKNNAIHKLLTQLEGDLDALNGKKITDVATIVNAQGARMEAMLESQASAKAQTDSQPIIVNNVNNSTNTTSANSVTYNTQNLIDEGVGFAY